MPKQQKQTKAVPEQLEQDSLVPYEVGEILSFSAPSGENYAIIIEDIEGENVTFRNLKPGCGPMTLELKAAQEILESPARVR